MNSESIKMKIRAVDQYGKEIDIPQTCNEDNRNGSLRPYHRTPCYIGNPITGVAVSARILQLHTLKETSLADFTYIEPYKQRCTFRPATAAVAAKIKKINNPILTMVYLVIGRSKTLKIAYVDSE